MAVFVYIPYRHVSIGSKGGAVAGGDSVADNTEDVEAEGGGELSGVERDLVVCAFEVR